jgi:hypothetical protein
LRVSGGFKPETIRPGRTPPAARVGDPRLEVDAREGGPTRGPFFVGRLEDLNTRALPSGFPYLVLTMIFAAVGLYHLRLYAEHRGLVEHLWFGVFALDIAVYSPLCTQWKYSLSDDFILLKNLEYIAILLLPAIGIQLTVSLFSRAIGRWLRAYQLSHVALAALVGLTPDLRLNLMLGSLCQLWAMPTIVFCCVVGVQEYRRGHPEAKILPSMFFLGTCLFDIAVDQDWVRGLRLMPVGMTVRGDFMGCLSRGEIQGEASWPAGELEAPNEKMDESV